MIKNILGQGIDIHLLGLRQLARQSGCAEATAVFQDSSYGIINHFALSTSQVTAILGFMEARGKASVGERKRGSIISIFVPTLCRRPPYADPDQLGLVYGLRTSRSQRLRMFLQPSTRFCDLLRLVFPLL